MTGLAGTRTVGGCVMHRLYAGFGAVKFGMTGSTAAGLGYHMVINKNMIAVTGCTINRILGRDGSHYIRPGTAVAGGARAVTVGRHVMHRIDGYHVGKACMTGCAGCGNRYLMSIKMGRQVDVREVTVITGHRGACYTAVDYTSIRRVNMAALANDHVSVGVDTANMLVSHVGNMAFKAGIIRHYGHIVICCMSGINNIGMTIVTVNRCLGIDKCLNIGSRAQMTGVTGAG